MLCIFLTLVFTQIYFIFWLEVSYHFIVERYYCKLKHRFLKVNVWLEISSIYYSKCKFYMILGLIKSFTKLFFRFFCIVFSSGLFTKLIYYFPITAFPVYDLDFVLLKSIVFCTIKERDLSQSFFFFFFFFFLGMNEYYSWWKLENMLVKMFYKQQKQGLKINLGMNTNTNFTGYLLKSYG